jgi:hypothetical protein
MRTAEHCQVLNEKLMSLSRSEQRTLYKGKGKSVSQGYVRSSTLDVEVSIKLISLDRSLDLTSHEGSSARFEPSRCWSWKLMFFSRPQVIPIQLGSSSSKG